MIKICYRYAGDGDGAGIIYNNAMLRIFKNIDTYNEEGKLAIWVKTIMINCSIDYCKKKNIFRNVVAQAPNYEISIEPEAFDRISGKELQELISTLPGATATVFRLFIYDGFTHKQIGEQLNISDSTSKWHVSEAKRILKDKIESLQSKEFYLHAI